jgi:predicted Zn-dependent protease
MYLSGDKATKHVSKAARALERGQLANAHRWSLPYDFHLENTELNKRLRLIHETTLMRIDPKRRDSNYFERMVSEDRDNPKLIALYAESLVLKDSVKASKLLSDLLERDLMPDAYAYRALALAHRTAGKKEEMSKSLSECKRMTKWKKVCRLSWPGERKRAKRKVGMFRRFRD